MAYDYRVRTAYEADDKQSPKIKAIASNAEKMASIVGDKVKNAFSSAGAAMDSFVASGAKMVGIAGAIALGGAIHGIKTGLVDINAHVEQTEIGFATIFNMLGKTGIEGGLTLAKGLISDIRKDAKDLPGEFKDFVGMAQTLSAPLINAGKGVEDIRNLTRQTVVSASALQVPFEQAAREMAMLVEGRAGTHNLLGMRLGINAHTMVEGANGAKTEFNKASTADRLKLIQELLAKGDESLQKFSKSWEGLSSSAIDAVKQLLGRATMPLFEKLKLDLEKINNLLGSRNAGDFADMVGDALVRGHDYAIEAVDYIHGRWVEIRDVGRELIEDLKKGWQFIEPYAKKAAEHPVETIKSLALLRGGLAAGQGAMSLAGNPLVGDMLKGIMKGGGAAAEGGVGGSAISNVSQLGILGGADREAQMAFHVAGGGGLFDAGMAGAQIAPAAEAVAPSLMAIVGPAGAVAIALAAVIGAIDLLTMDGAELGAFFNTMSKAGQEVWRDIKENFGAAVTSAGQTLKDLWTAARPLVDMLGFALLGAIDGAIYAIRGLLYPFQQLAAAIAWVVKKIPGLTPGGTGFSGEENMGGQKKAPIDLKRVGDIHTELEAMDAMNANKASKLHGAGKTTVTNHNYFTVMQENDPERFAVNVATYLDKVSKHPTRPAGVSSFLTK